MLLAALPPEIVEALHALPDRESLIEVVLDLGRRPEARFPDREVELLEREIVDADLQYVVEHIGSFGDDNRAGIERTLHRISAIRNRNGKVVGLTCRIGRAVYGTIEIIADFVETREVDPDHGPPGHRQDDDAARGRPRPRRRHRKRVVVVDTSNEIAGDGDIPHPAIGKARRMQVRTPSLQHEVMIEAVENHMPQVIVIDEIGTELEAQAARTIAERGVQLIGTAHGNNLDNLMLNPTLSDLIGGIQSVTLGDEEARRRRRRRASSSASSRRRSTSSSRSRIASGCSSTATSRPRSTRCCSASPSRPSSAGATRRASIARSRGPSRPPGGRRGPVQRADRVRRRGAATRVARRGSYRTGGYAGEDRPPAAAGVSPGRVGRLAIGASGLRPDRAWGTRPGGRPIGLGGGDPRGAVRRCPQHPLRRR